MWVFNPFTGKLDFSGGGSGNAPYIDGEVQYYADLPITVGTPQINSAYLVREASGTWFINRHPAGIYVRLGNSGALTDWTYAGTFPDVFSDANFTIYHDTDSSREVQFDVSNISTATTRTLTVPDANGTIVLNPMTAAGDIIVGGSSGTPNRLQLGSSNQQLRVNSGATALEYFTPTASVTAVGPSASDVLSVSGSDLVADDPGADRIVFWDDSAGKLTHLEVSSGLTITGTALSTNFQIDGGTPTSIYGATTPVNGGTP